MHMLADLVELVIGVDTHKDTHTAAVVAAATGAVLEQATVPATPAGYRQLLRHSPTDTTVGECGRSRAPAATAPA
jgi:transposase